MLAVPFAAAVLLTTPCDTLLHDRADTARNNIILGRDGAEAIEAWRHVLASGGTVAWGVTEYNVDARSGWVFAFDRTALRVYRGKEFGVLEREVTPCLSTPTLPEAVIPWDNVREIEAGNWVLWFRLKQPIELRSDRGKRKTVKELKAYFHGAPSSTLTYHYSVTPTEYRTFWGTTIYRYENLRGIAVGPTDFQRRLQFVLANVVDPNHRITMKRKSRGAGW
jgi:hypothetical protein